MISLFQEYAKPGIFWGFGTILTEHLAFLFSKTGGIF